jgi:hypothetical protein
MPSATRNRPAVHNALDQPGSTAAASATGKIKLDELIRVSESARNKLLDLEDLTGAGHLKGSFTKVASNAPNTTILHEAAEDLDTAGAEIQEAKEKVAAVADGEARKPLR